MIGFGPVALQRLRRYLWLFMSEPPRAARRTGVSAALPVACLVRLVALVPEVDSAYRAAGDHQLQVVQGHGGALIGLGVVVPAS
jgi:hypothetical protein